MINYDITNYESCVETISKLTEIEVDICREFIQYGTIPRVDLRGQLELFLLTQTNVSTISAPIETINFICAHITTSDNECQDIKDSGLVDLQQAYKNINGGLRRFLDGHGVKINLEKKKIRYRDKEYSIENTGADTLAGTVANKFYYDYSLCGFKYLGRDRRYSCINECPEIINNIGRLFEINLKAEWKKDHSTYIIKYIIKNEQLINGYFETDINELLFEAYEKAVENLAHYEVAVTKNGIQIPIDDIISIEPLNI